MKYNKTQEELVLYKTEGDVSLYDFENITPKFFILEQTQESVL